MPTNRRRKVRHLEGLTVAQKCFLRGEPLPGDVGFAEKMPFVWLSQAKRDHIDETLPDGSLRASELWRLYGTEILADRRKRRLRSRHPLCDRFGETAS